MTNLFYSVFAALLAMFTRLKGWRYPLTSRVTKGIRFQFTERRIETMIHSRLKYSPLLKFLTKLRAEMVVVGSIYEGKLHVNVYRVTANRRNANDAVSPYNPNRGTDGTFTFLASKGRLSHVHTPANVRGKYFLELDPFMSYVIPLTRNERDYINDALYLESPLLNSDDEATLSLNH